MNRGKYARVGQNGSAVANARRVFWGLVVGAVVLGGVALGLAIYALVGANTANAVPPSERVFDTKVNHGNVPDIGDKWLYRGRDLDNSAYSPSSQINSNNVHTLVETFKSGIGQDPTLGGTIAGAVRADISWAGVSVDETYIFITTHNQRNEAGTTLDQTGYIMAFNRATGVRVWNKAFTSYSLDNGMAQGGSKTEMTAAIHGDYLYVGSKNVRPQTYASTSYQSITNPTIFGFPAGGKVNRAHVYCINKHTGAEVWATEVGAVATDFGSPDNLLFLSMSPIVFELQGVPVVAIGTSSGNSFVPTYSGSDETNAKKYNQILGFGGLGANPNTRMTDVGRMILMNGNTGAIMSTTMMGPPLYAVNDTLQADSVVYDDNDENYDMEIWHIVQPSDPELNPILPQYGRSKMIISIMPNASIPAASPLAGLSVIDNTGANFIITAGFAPANLDFLTVEMEVEFVPGTTDFYRLSPQFATAYDTTTADLEGAGGNVPARIVKHLKVGDVLTEQDAYECNYYGASIWGSTPSINYDRNGVPTEMYFSTGQAHKIPYDQTKRFPSPVERLFNIKQRQDVFNSSKTQINLDNERQSNVDRVNGINAARNIPISPRGEQMLNNAVVAINLRPGKLGEIIWSKKSVGYDTWRLGMALFQQRNTEFGIAPGFTNMEAHFGMLRGHDGDYGESPYFCPNCGSAGSDYIVAPNKGGSVSVLRITDVNHGPTAVTESAFSLLGNPGLLGGSNYGSVLVKNTRKLCTVQANEAAGFGSAVDLPFNKRSLPPVMEWFPVNEHDAATIAPFTHRQSYLSCYDFRNNSIDYEVALQTTPPENGYATVTAFAGGADLIYVQPNAHEIQIRRAATGALVHTIAVDSAGTNGPVVLKREIVVAAGRSGFLGDNPAGTNYNGAKYVYKFSLP